MARTVFTHIFGVKSLWHREIDLHRAALPLAANRVLERVFDLGPIESAFAFGDFIRAPGCLQALHQRRLGLVPDRVGADALRRPGRDLVDDVVKAKVGIDPLQQRRVVDALLQNLVFGAKNMAVILREAAYPHDAVQPARGLVAMALAEFAVAQRQIAVALDALLEYQDVAGTVHRLERIVALFRFGDEHVLAVLVPMAGLLPQALVDDLRTLDFLVAVVAVDLAHVLLDALPQRPALGVPEHQSRRMVIDMEKIEFAPEFAVVALLGFLQHGQMLLQRVLASPCGAVDPLQHLVAVVTAPVSARELHQLEEFQPAGAGHVRSAAKIFKCTLTVQRNIFASRYAAYDLGLVMLAKALEIVDGCVARQDPARHRFVARRQGGHARFDRLQVLRCEGALVRKIVKKSVLDYRPDGYLRIRKQVLDRVREQVRGRVADDVQPLVVLGRDDGEGAVAIQAMAGIDQFSVDLAPECRLGESGADRCSDFRNRHRPGEVALGSVR